MTNPEKYTTLKISDALKALDACRALVDAYNAGAANGGSVNWEDVDDAARLAAAALGEELVDPNLIDDEE